MTIKDLTVEQQKEGIKALRKEWGLESKDISNGRVKWKEAKFFPEVPSFWKESFVSTYHVLSDQASDYVRIFDYKGLHVVCSVQLYEGNEWLHVSFSRKNKLPDYNDILLIRENFIGTNKKCIMVFPDKEHYVNISKYCLHLWCSLDFHLPDFDVDLPGIGPSI